MTHAATSRRGRRSVAATFAWPLALAVLTISALVAGLLGEGWVDTAAVASLAAPTVYGAWKLARALGPAGGS